MSEQRTTDERTQAIALANRLLDEPNADPDDDLRTLARQLLRRHETAENHRETLRGIADMDPATEGDRMRLWARDALSGYTETAEVSMKKMQDERNRLHSQATEYRTWLVERVAWLKYEMDHGGDWKYLNLKREETAYCLEKLNVYITALEKQS